MNAFLTQSSLSNTHGDREEMMRTNPEVVRYFLHTHASDEVTVIIDAALARYKK